MAVSIDYVGNRGRNNTAAIDINEGPVGANGRITRLGVDVFDPNGELVPLETRRRATPRTSNSSSSRRWRRSTPTSTRWNSGSTSGCRTGGPAA